MIATKQSILLNYCACVICLKLKGIELPFLKKQRLDLYKIDTYHYGNIEIKKLLPRFKTKGTYH